MHVDLAMVGLLVVYQKKFFENGILFSCVCMSWGSGYGSIF